MIDGSIQMIRIKLILLARKVRLLGSENQDLKEKLKLLHFLSLRKVQMNLVRNIGDESEKYDWIIEKIRFYDPQYLRRW